jgi:hypothetical protein
MVCLTQYLLNQIASLQIVFAGHSRNSETNSQDNRAMRAIERRTPTKICYIRNLN